MENNILNDLILIFYIYTTYTLTYILIFYDYISHIGLKFKKMCAKIQQPILRWN